MHKVDTKLFGICNLVANISDLFVANICNLENVQIFFKNCLIYWILRYNFLTILHANIVCTAEAIKILPLKMLYGHITCNDI